MKTNEIILSLVSKSGESKNSILTKLKLNHNFFIDLKKGQIPSAENVAKIAQYFNVSTDYLLGLTTVASRDYIIIYESLHPEMREVAKLHMEGLKAGQSAAIQTTIVS